jgi:putative membrane protein
MKKQLTKLNILLLSGILTVSACNNSQSSSQSTTDSSTVSAKIDTAVQNLKQKAENMVNEGNPDSNFVVKATIANKEELSILQAGIDNGTSKELKAHARMMLADHKKLGDKVSAYAGSKGYTLPTDDNGKANDELSKLNNHNKGSDWDKSWVDFMVNAHSDDINMFEKAQNNVKDSMLKNMIGDALPILHNHYDMVKQLQNNMSTGQ